MMLSRFHWTLLAAAAIAALPAIGQGPSTAPAPHNATSDYCDPSLKRALVLSGGGLKGAFQAGAVYHLIVDRKCDFSEFAGVSVGSLNSVILAQAERSTDPDTSLRNLSDRAEKMVKVWQGVTSPKQILKPRWPGWMWALAVRYGMFGVESLNTFDPLMHLIETNVDVNALADRGRPVRVGTVSIWDGTYQEVGPTANFPNHDRKLFLKYVYASALIPIVGQMPKIQQTDQDSNPKQWIQYGDGGILNNTPIANYFHKCDSPKSSQLSEDERDCRAWMREGTPPPQAAQQLFIVVTAPFDKEVVHYPVDPKLLANGSRQVTDGKKILARTIDLILETDFREDLKLMYQANSVLAWRKQVYDAASSSLTGEQRTDFDRKFADINRDFPLHSYNEPADGGPSLPYQILVVAPEKIYSETFAVNSDNIAAQLHYGCLESDRMMQQDFHRASMADKCEARFPLPIPKTAVAKK